ncbi:MAG: hypothetical protein R3Y29_06880, partial [bacterium]
LYIETVNSSGNTSTTDEILKLQKKSELYFVGVNISVLDKDPNLPLIEVLDDTKIILTQDSSSKLTTSYMVKTNNNPVSPTISVADGKKLEFTEDGGVMHVMARQNGEAIGGSFGNSTDGNLNSIIFEEIKVSGVGLKEGNINFSGSTLTINNYGNINDSTYLDESTYIIIENTTKGTSSDVKIIVNGNNDVPTNIVIRDLSLSTGSNNTFTINSGKVNLITNGTSNFVSTGNGIYIPNGTTLNIYEAPLEGLDTDGILNVTTSGNQKSSIRVNGTLNVYSGDLNVYCKATWATAIGTGWNESGGGTINFHGGNTYTNVTRGNSYSLGSRISINSFTNINFYGGYISVNTEVLNSNLKVDGSAIILFETTDKVSKDNDNTTFIYNSKNNIKIDSNQLAKWDWNGIVGAYNKTSTAHFTVYGSVLLSDDFTLRDGDILEFFSLNVPYDEQGFSADTPLDADIHYANLKFETGYKLINNGIILRRAFLFENPFTRSINIEGSGVTIIELTSDFCIYPVTSSSGLENAYKGTDLLNYLNIKEDNKDLINADYIDIKLEYIKKDDDDNSPSDSNLSQYLITTLGTFNVKGTPKYKTYNDVISDISIGNLKSNNNTNNVVFYGEEFNRTLTVDNTDISKVSLSSLSLENTNSVIYKTIPYTEDELLGYLSFKVGNTTLTQNVDYIPSIYLANEAEGYTKDNVIYNPTDEQMTSMYKQATSIDYKNAGTLYLKVDASEISIFYSGIVFMEFEIEPRDLEATNISTFEGILENVEFNSTSNKPNLEITYKYGGSDNTTKLTLIENEHYEIAYYYLDKPNDEVSPDELKNIGGVKVVVTGIGNFEGEVELIYYIQGDLEAYGTIKLNEENLKDGKLEIGLAGRPKVEDIQVYFDSNVEPLIYGVDYEMSSTIDTRNQTINITVTGINNYMNTTQTTSEYTLEGIVEPIVGDLSANIYFKPDNELDEQYIPVVISLGELKEEDKNKLSGTNYEDYLLIDDNNNGYVTLQYGNDDYSITVEEADNNASNVVNVKLKLNGESNLFEIFTTLAKDENYSYEFELEPNPAGSGTSKDFRFGIINLVDPVYARPDNLLSDERIEEDLVLIVYEDKQVLTKDEDYTIVYNNDEDKTVTVKGKGEFLEEEITFKIQPKEAGTGIGVDFGKGIINEVDPIKVYEDTTFDSDDEFKEFIQKSLKLARNQVLEHNTDYTLEFDSLPIDSGSIVQNFFSIIANAKESTSIYTGTTKSFIVDLEIVSDYINTDNFYVKPDYTLDLSKIIINDPLDISNNLSSTYYSIEPILNTSGFFDDKVKVIFTKEYYNFIQTIVDDENIDNNSESKKLTAKAFIDMVKLHESGGYYKDFNAIPKEAGTSNSKDLDSGIIDIIDAIYKRPDNVFYKEDLILKTNGVILEESNYDILMLMEDTNELNSTWKTSIRHKDAENLINSNFDQKIILTASNNGNYIGSTSFYIDIKEAGEGEGSDITKGIIESLDVIYLRPDNHLYNEDIKLKINDNLLIEGVDYEIVELTSDLSSKRTLTISALEDSKYTGKNYKFTFTPHQAGFNNSGTNDLSYGLIYNNTEVRKRMDGNLYIEDLNVFINGASAPTKSQSDWHLLSLDYYDIEFNDNFG